MQKSLLLDRMVLHSASGFLFYSLVTYGTSFCPLTMLVTVFQGWHAALTYIFLPDESTLGPWSVGSHERGGGACTCKGFQIWGFVKFLQILETSICADT